MTAREHRSLDPDKERQQAAAAKVAIAGAVVLFLISAVAGILTDSVTLLLDASASLVILAVALLMHSSIRKIHRPPDHLYNFGYTKYEPLTAVIQGAFIIATCAVRIKFAIQDIIHPDSITGYGLPAIATFASGLIGIWITWHIASIARLTGSQMLKTSAMHWKVDTVLAFGISAGFFIGLALHSLGYTAITPYVDPVMALILALLLIQAPIKTVTGNILELLDAVPGEHVQSKVRTVVEGYKPASFGVERLRARQAGGKIFIDICFIVRPEQTVEEVARLADGFECEMKKHLPGSDVVVSFKPKKG